MPVIYKKRSIDYTAEFVCSPFVALVYTVLIVLLPSDNTFNKLHTPCLKNVPLLACYNFDTRE